MKRKFVSKLFVITTFAMFGLNLNPTVFANEVITDKVEVNQYSNQQESYLIQYRHKNSGQKILQVFITKDAYQERLKELDSSDSHLIMGERMVRNGFVDLFLTEVEVK